VGRLIDALLRRATRTGMRRGLSGEHWAWFLIAAAAYVLRRARRPDERTERIDLRPGERYVVTLLPSVARRRTRRGGGPGSDATAEGPEEAFDARPAGG
jgi:hypothetical protein